MSETSWGELVDNSDYFPNPVKDLMHYQTLPSGEIIRDQKANTSFVEDASAQCPNSHRSRQSYKTLGPEDPGI